MRGILINLQARRTVNEVMLTEVYAMRHVCDGELSLPVMVEQRSLAAHVKTWDNTGTGKLHVIDDAIPRSAFNSNSFNINSARCVRRVIVEYLG
jgi:hypothetical protein